MLFRSVIDSAPVFKNACLLSSESNRYEYEFDIGGTPISDILKQIGTVANIQDVEIKKSPIEDVIAGLYMKWEK